MMCVFDVVICGKMVEIQVSYCTVCVSAYSFYSVLVQYIFLLLCVCDVCEVVGHV